MGALIMFTLVIVIANVGGFYFYFQDKKEAHKTKMKKNNAQLSQNLR